MTQARQLMQDLSTMSAVAALSRNSHNLHSHERLAEVGTVFKFMDYSAMLMKVGEEELELIEGTWEFTPPQNGMDVQQHAATPDGIRRTFHVTEMGHDS